MRKILSWHRSSPESSTHQRVYILIGYPDPRWLCEIDMNKSLRLIPRLIGSAAFLRVEPYLTSGIHENERNEADVDVSFVVCCWMQHDINASNSEL